MAMKLNSSAVICFLVMALLLGSIVPSSAQGCNLSGLNSCLPAYQGGPVTGACCGALRSLTPCFCSYASNPSYRSIIYSGSTNKALLLCAKMQHLLLLL
ncbi:hypothetical protein EJ110_NYTH06322 [Nymphaea thermarum]|nr:hypothetical protein EJ110_NYTH06322 [Nymphaea thermarum]